MHERNFERAPTSHGTTVRSAPALAVKVEAPRNTLGDSTSDEERRTYDDTRPAQLLRQFSIREGPSAEKPDQDA
jgi:hypothetical protein